MNLNHILKNKTVLSEAETMKQLIMYEMSTQAHCKNMSVVMFQQNCSWVLSKRDERESGNRRGQNAFAEGTMLF